ncbi:MAG: hypothetical protein H0V43_01850 [Gemmatimonadales bacterium]|nr:hypothetical protein [Gemmatimonadales bacterium]
MLAHFDKMKLSYEDSNRIKLACVRSWFGRKLRIAPSVPPLTPDQPLLKPELAINSIGAFLTNMTKLAGYTVSQFVEQISVLEHSLLCQITPREIITKYRNPAAGTPHLSALARFFNIVSYWITSKVRALHCFSSSLLHASTKKLISDENTKEQQNIRKKSWKKKRSE